MHTCIDEFLDGYGFHEDLVEDVPGTRVRAREIAQRTRDDRAALSAAGDARTPAVWMHRFAQTDRAFHTGEVSHLATIHVSQRVATRIGVSKGARRVRARKVRGEFYP